MLRPTYNDLIGSLNHGMDEGEREVESRYSVVIASAKRARQLIDGEHALIAGAEGRKPLSVAIDEISRNAVTIHQGAVNEELPEYHESREDFSRYTEEEEEDELEKDGEEDGELPGEEEKEDFAPHETVSEEENYGSDSEA